MTKERRVYNYLDEVAIALEGPKEMIDLCQNNIDESPMFGESYGEVSIIRGAPVAIVRDSSLPYASIKSTPVNGNIRLDYFRYNTLTRSYLTTGLNKHTIEYHIENDCDGPLRCFLKIYLDSPKSEHKSLIHGTSLAIGDTGLLIAGPCWSGKTSTSFKLIDVFGAELVTEGTSLVSHSKEGGLNAFYIPRPVYARFSLIHQLSKMKVLLDPTSWDVEQYFDSDALHRIIKARRFDLDAGVRITRSKLAKIMDMNVRSITGINKLIFTKYAAGGSVSVKNLSPEEVVYHLRANEFVKQINFEKVENQKKERPPIRSQIDLSWLNNVRGSLLTFNGLDDLTPKLLEDLIK